MKARTHYLPRNILPIQKNSVCIRQQLSQITSSGLRIHYMDESGTKEIEISQKSRWSLCSGVQSSFGDQAVFCLPHPRQLVDPFSGPSPLLWLTLATFFFYVFVSSVYKWFPPYFPFQLLERRSSLANCHCSFWAKLFLLLLPDSFLGCRWPLVGCPWFTCSPWVQSLAIPYPNNSLELQSLARVCS